MQLQKLTMVTNVTVGSALALALALIRLQQEADVLWHVKVERSYVEAADAGG
jgi:hypothetical protein